MYNSVRVLGRLRGSVAARRVLPSAAAATRSPVFISFCWWAGAKKAPLTFNVCPDSGHTLNVKEDKHQRR